MAGKPDSLEALFKSKAKKKPKAVNLNAGRPPEPPKPILARQLIAEGAVEAAEGWERALRHDQELLKACSLWIKEVEADGACLFRAFADQLEGDGGSMHATYREQCVDFLKAHRADYEPFIEEDFDEYCRRMREASTWGGHVEVEALAKCLGVSALIYRPAEAREPADLERTTIEILTSEPGEGRCVQLSFHPKHHAGQHYNSVRCADDNGKEPVPVTSAAELRRRLQDALLPKEATPEAQEEEAADGSKRKSRSSAKVF